MSNFFNKKTNKVSLKIILIIAMITTLILIGCYFLLFSKKLSLKDAIVEIKDTAEEIETERIQIVEEDQNNDQEKSFESLKSLPREVLIDVPFISQAPLGVWGERQKEACEEASLIMVFYYLQKKQLNNKIGEKEIQKIIDFQIEKYGDYRDSNVEQVVKLAADYYGIKNLRIIYDFDKSIIKKELAKNNPIIIPAAGRELSNPYFTQPGPLYHMLVLVGYSDGKIIANDPGTRRGKNYRYDIDILYGAIHDFTGKKEKIKEGRRAMIVIDNNL